MSTASAFQVSAPEPCELLLSDDAPHLIHELSARGPLCPALIAVGTGLPETEVVARLDTLAAHGLVRPLGNGTYESARERIVEVMELAQRSFLGE